MFDKNELLCKAWDLYYSAEHANDPFYTKYDALYEATKDMDISEEDYFALMEEMDYL